MNNYSEKKTVDRREQAPKYSNQGFEHFPISCYKISTTVQIISEILSTLTLDHSQHRHNITIRTKGRHCILPGVQVSP